MLGHAKHAPQGEQQDFSIGVLLLFVDPGSFQKDPMSQESDHKSSNQDDFFNSYRACLCKILRMLLLEMFLALQHIHQTFQVAL